MTVTDVDRLANLCDVDPSVISEYSPEALFLAAVTSALGAGIGGVFALLLVIKAWLDLREGAIGVTRTAKRGGEVFRRYRGKAAAIAPLALVVAATAQAGTVLLCFVVGNFISMIAFPERATEALSAFRASALYTSEVNQYFTVKWLSSALSVLQSQLSWDWISTAYVTLAILLIARSYRLAHEGRSLQGIVYILAWPCCVIYVMLRLMIAYLIVLAVAALALAVLILLFVGHLDVSNYGPQNLLALAPAAGSAVAATVFFFACKAGIQSSALVVSMLSNRSRSWQH